MKNSKKRIRYNYQIKSSKLRVIGSDGKQIGVLTLTDALKKAKDEDMDLIEIAPFAKPPVAKIMKLGKFKYDEEKRLKKAKKGSKSSDLKEIRFSPFIAENDFNVRLDRINEFLSGNDKVRLVVVFKGRQMGSKPFGYKILDRVMNAVKDNVVVDMEPKFLGRRLIMVISPTKKAKVDKDTQTKKQEGGKTNTNSKEKVKTKNKTESKSKKELKKKVKKS